MDFGFLSALRSAVLLIASTAFFAVGSANADEQVEDAPVVTVFVRTISAMGPTEQDKTLNDAKQVESTSTKKVDPTLKDLQPKLEDLPFSSFKLLASKQQNLQLRRREVIQLPNGQSLAFRPMYLDQKRVGLWLNWKDSGGAEILNTRIHFDADDAVLTGTEGEHDAGLILAIKAVPVGR